jgi:hypothetical protein
VLTIPPPTLAYASTNDTFDRRQFTSFLYVSACFALLKVAASACHAAYYAPHLDAKEAPFFHWDWLYSNIIVMFAAGTFAGSAIAHRWRNSAGSLTAFRIAAWIFIIALLLDACVRLYLVITPHGVEIDLVRKFLMDIVIPAIALMFASKRRHSNRAPYFHLCILNSLVLLATACVLLPVAIDFDSFMQALIWLRPVHLRVQGGFVFIAEAIQVALVLPLALAAAAAFLRLHLAWRLMVWTCAVLLVVALLAIIHSSILPVLQYLAITKPSGYEPIANAYVITKSLGTGATLAAVPAAILLYLLRPQTRTLFHLPPKPPTPW